MKAPKPGRGCCRLPGWKSRFDCHAENGNVSQKLFEASFCASFWRRFPTQWGSTLSQRTFSRWPLTTKKTCGIPFSYQIQKPLQGRSIMMYDVKKKQWPLPKGTCARRITRKLNRRITRSSCQRTAGLLRGKFPAVGGCLRPGVHRECGTNLLLRAAEKVLRGLRPPPPQLDFGAHLRR